MILEQIKGPEDLKKLTSEELSQLAEEIRAFLIEKISHTGGTFSFQPGSCGADHCSVSYL